MAALASTYSAHASSIVHDAIAARNSRKNQYSPGAHSGAIRTSGVRLAVPRGDWIGCISEIERQLVIREAERVAETRRVVAKQAPLAGRVSQPAR